MDFLNNFDEFLSMIHDFWVKNITQNCVLFKSFILSRIKIHISLVDAYKKSQM